MFISWQYNESMLKYIILVLILGSFSFPLSENEDCRCQQNPISGEIDGTWIPNFGHL